MTALQDLANAGCIVIEGPNMAEDSSRRFPLGDGGQAARRDHQSASIRVLRGPGPSPTCTCPSGPAAAAFLAHGLLCVQALRTRRMPGAVPPAHHSH
jgi:hypothetical protein